MTVASQRRTFRPVGVIVVMWATVVVLLVLTAIVGLRLPEGYRFSTSQTATIFVLIGFVALFALAMSASRVTADDETLLFVNGLRRRSLSWDEVAGISMNRGAPWPTVVTKDGREFALFAVQGSEGDPAHDAVTWLAGHVR